jgi:hypothetical protein
MWEVGQASSLPGGGIGRLEAYPTNLTPRSVADCAVAVEEPARESDSGSLARPEEVAWGYPPTDHRFDRKK